MMADSQLCWLVCVILCVRNVACKAPDGQMYVLSRHASGCVTVNTTRQKDWMCPATKPLTESMGLLYETNNRVINATLKLIESDVASNRNVACKSAVKAVICKRITPECLDNGKKVDFGDYTPLCEAVNNSCPAEDNKLCSSTISGQHDEVSCVAASQPVIGVCPQPKYKMPPAMLEQYKETSIELVPLFTGFGPGNPLFSNECLTKLKEIFCVQVVCSADEKRLLIKHDHEDCQNIVEKTCFSSSMNLPPIPQLQTLYKDLKSLLQAYCPMYPPSGTAAELAPPEVNSTTAPATTTVEKLNTHQTTTKKPGNGASNTKLGIQHLLVAIILLKIFY